jgi:2-methylisocitrate lyase-like PEP mutase family enzyme
MSKAKALRHRIAAGETILAPGAYDGIGARLIAQAGFHAVYASGGAIARSAALPDLGLLSVSRIIERIAEICDATDLPVIADADTGYGNALNTRVTVQGFARAGVAGLHLEDQLFPKRCGHLDNKSLVPTAEMVGKLRAACDARPDPDLLIIGRTDAIAVEGLDAALDRARAYHEAGADVIFVEAPRSLAEIERIAREVPGPKLINMFHGGKTPLVSSADLQAMGYAIIIVPSDLQRAAIRAMQDTLAALARDGHSMAMEARMVSFQDREVLAGTEDWLRRDAQYAV